MTESGGLDNWLVREALAGTRVEVSFWLTRREWWHYRYAKGLVTKDEAEERLGAELDRAEVLHMERVIRHLTMG